MLCPHPLLFSQKQRGRHHGLPISQMRTLRLRTELKFTQVVDGRSGPSLEPTLLPLKSLLTQGLQEPQPGGPGDQLQEFMSVAVQLWLTSVSEHVLGRLSVISEMQKLRPERGSNLPHGTGPQTQTFLLPPFQASTNFQQTNPIRPLVRPALWPRCAWCSPFS